MSAALMKRPLSRYAWRTGQTSIPTGGFTDGRIDIAEYLEDMADRERQTEVGTVAELLDEIESENLYQVLVAVDGRTLKIVLLKMQGYSTKEIAPLVHLTTGAIYARLDHLRKKLRKIL